MHASPTDGAFARKWNADNRLHADFRGPARPTQKVGGIYAQDLNLTGQKSVKDCRLHASASPGIRSKSTVGVTGGHVVGAVGDASVRYGRIAKTPRSRAGRKQRQRAERERIMAALIERNLI